MVDAGSLFDVDATHCADFAKPSQVPDGWELYTEYDPCCLLYVPSSPQYLPPPLTWRACDSAWSGDGGIDAGECRQIDATAAASPEFGASVRAGVVTLETTEAVNGAYASVVVDADGPVHQAFMQVGGSCGPAPRDMRDGKYVYRIYNTGSFNGGGFIAGDVSEFRPSFVHHFMDQIDHGVVVGALGVLDVDQGDTLNLYEWNDAPKAISNPQDIGLRSSFPLFSGSALFWSASGGSYNRVAAYTHDAGATDLLSSGSDPTVGYDDFGSDGTDMVWLAGQGHDAGAIAFDSANIMTSPFATNPLNVVARRLRSETPSGFGVSPTKVGCGYAARANGDYLRIVKISDGSSWVLNNRLPWEWVNPLAITCDEVFATVGTGGGNVNIARVRISSLGPGIPAD